VVHASGHRAGRHQQDREQGSGSREPGSGALLRTDVEDQRDRLSYGDVTEKRPRVLVMPSKGRARDYARCRVESQQRLVTFCDA
jgi:hypothetical protein